MSLTIKPARKEKPRLSFWDIWNMSFGFLGIQMGFALQIANTSRIFQTLDARVEDLAIYWLAGPITGLLVQPIIGYLSDRTWSPKWGRRRPYFMIGAILASLALFVMPNSPGLWIAIGMLWIMDSSFNIAMEPFRAFVGDKLPAEQRTSGFAMQSFFIGVGAVVASLLPYIFTNWFGISNTAPEGIIPPSVKWSFYVGAAGFLMAVLWTVFKSKEYSPEEMEAFEADIEGDEAEEVFKTKEDFAENAKKHFTASFVFLLLGGAFLAYILANELSRDLLVIAFMLIGFGIIGLISGALQKTGAVKNFLVTMANDIQFMPNTMKQLAVVQFFSWFALFAMWIYTTPAVTEFIFGSSDPTSPVYNDGADWVSVCFAVYNGVAALVAFLIPVLARKTNRRMAHMICLFAGGIGLASIYFISNPNMLLLSMVGVGIAWASILSMPYAILTGSLPAKKMGYYMGIFNFFIVIPQMVAASILGFFLAKFFASSSIYAMLIGGISFFIAGLMNFFVEDRDEV